MKLDPEHIRQRLLLQTADELNPLVVSPASISQAAVLVLLCPGNAGPVIILTRRSTELPQHAGQISFPGGRMHANDTSLEATALRETAEETGLDPATVIVLGRLPVTTVSSGFLITPVVAWAKARPQLQANPREVVEMIDCPLALALDSAAYKTGSQERDGIRREFWYIEFDGHYVWGATARMLRSLAVLLAN